MSLTPWGFDTACQFADLALGSIFRTDDLPLNQVMIKVAGPTRLSSWILVLGGSSDVAYPSPSYGAMEDVRGNPIWSVDAPTTIAALGTPIDQSAGEVVFPGYLIVGPAGRLGVFIEGSLCIDPTNGGRFQVESRTVPAYDRWVIDVFASQGQTTLMRYTGPMTG